MEHKSPYDALLHEVCIGLGFCGDVVDGKPLRVQDFVPPDGQVSADQFVEWVFRAEGMDPKEPGAIKHASSLRDSFVRHMGGDSVDARTLK